MRRLPTLSLFTVLAFSALLAPRGVPDLEAEGVRSGECPRPGCERSLGSAGTRAKHRYCRDAWDAYDACSARVGGMRTPITSHRFERPLVTSASYPPGTFLDVDPASGRIEEVFDPCNLRLDAAPAGSPLPDLRQPDTQFAVLASRMLGRDGVGQASLDLGSSEWSRVGIASREVRASFDLSVPAVAVAGSGDFEKMSFQAWRDPNHAQRLAEYSSTEVNDCCLRRGCGTHLVVGSRRLERYEYVYSSSEVEVSGGTAVWKVGASTQVAGGEFAKTDFYELRLARMPSPSTPIRDLCPIPPTLTAVRGQETTIRLRCAIGDLTFTGQNMLPPTVVRDEQDPAIVEVRFRSSAEPGTVATLVASLPGGRSESIQVVVAGDGTPLGDPEVAVREGEDGEWAVQVSTGFGRYTVVTPVPVDDICADYVREAVSNVFDGEAGATSTVPSPGGGAEGSGGEAGGG